MACPDRSPPGQGKRAKLSYKSLKLALAQSSGLGPFFSFHRPLVFNARSASPTGVSLFPFLGFHSFRLTLVIPFAAGQPYFDTFCQFSCKHARYVWTIPGGRGARHPGRFRLHFCPGQQRCGPLRRKLILCGVSKFLQTWVC